MKREAGLVTGGLLCNGLGGYHNGVTFLWNKIQKITTMMDRVVTFRFDYRLKIDIQKLAQMWISLVIRTTLLQRRRVMLGNIGDNNGNDLNEDEENSLPLLRRPPPPLLQTKNTKQNRQTKKRTKMENAYRSYPRFIFKRGVSGCKTKASRDSQVQVSLF